MPDLTKRGFKKPLDNEAYDIKVTNFNTDLIETELDKLILKNGDGKDITVAFTEAEQDTELISNSKLSNLFGLVKKKLGLINHNKQDKATESLQTTSKEIVGAINEHEKDIADISQQLEQKADKNRTIYRENSINLNGGTLWSQVAWYVSQGVYTGSFYAYGATDTNGLSGFVTWKGDATATGWVYVDLNDLYNGKVYHNFISVVNGVWRYTTWQEITTIDKTMYNFNGRSLAGTTILDTIVSLFNSGQECGSLYCHSASDNPSSEQDVGWKVITWKSTTYSPNPILVTLESYLTNKTYKRWLVKSGSNFVWVTPWQEIATIDKIDILSTQLATKAPAHQSGTTTPSVYVGNGVLYGVY